MPLRSSFIEIGAAEVGLLQVRAGEVRLSQDRLVKIRALERHASKPGLSEVRIAEVVAIEDETGVALGEVMGSDHRMDLWMLESPLVPHLLAAPERAEVFCRLPLACPELHGAIDVRARRRGQRLVVSREHGDRVALDCQPALNIALEGKALVELGHCLLR